MKPIRKVCQFLERCDGHREMSGSLGSCDSSTKV